MVLLDIQRQVAIDLPSDEDFQRWAEVVLLPQSTDTEVVIRLVESDEIQQLNKTYRQQNKPTNVLSFPFEAPPPIDLPLLGDLVICVSVVEKEAKEQKISLKAHWAHMVIHGIFHLLGYDHVTDTDAKVMETKEQQALAQLGFPDPYRY